MGPLTSPHRLKSRILADAVDDNVSTIRGDLPRALRPVRRRLALWGPRGGLIVLIVGLVLAVVGMARRSNAGGPAPASVTTTAAGFLAAAAPPSVDPAVLERTVDPGVLELGVRRVILDAGHGGDNPGTASAEGMEEKSLTLDIALRARDRLAEDGFDVVMTRMTDESLSLQERAEFANGTRGDIFVSIHLNALPASAKGIETYYLGPSDGPERDAIAAAENQQSGYSLSDMRSLLERIYADARRDESRRLAESVQQAMVRRMRQVDPGLTNRGVKRAPFVVLVATEMPAILAEVACLSNVEEAERLGTEEYRQQLAEALADGVRAFARNPGAQPPT